MSGSSLVPYNSGFHASDSSSLDGSHPDMICNIYFFIVIYRINISSYFFLIFNITIPSSDNVTCDTHFSCQYDAMVDYDQYKTLINWR